MTALIGAIFTLLYLGLVYGILVIPYLSRKFGIESKSKMVDIFWMAIGMSIGYIFIITYHYYNDLQINSLQQGLFLMLLYIAVVYGYGITPYTTRKSQVISNTKIIDMSLKLILLLLIMLMIYTPISYYL
jgi:MFS family permease